MWRKGIIYLDDILVLSHKERTLRKDLAEVTQTLSQLGFVINVKKLVFDPSPVLDFLGVTVDPSGTSVGLPRGS